MNDHRTIFIGTENFGSSANQSLFSRLKDKDITAYIVRNLDFIKLNRALQKFKNIYVEKYGLEPSPLSAYTYDAVSIILTTLKKQNKLNTNNILKTNYHGITGAYIHNNQFIRSNQYVILSIGKKGFIYEE